MLLTRATVDEEAGPEEQKVRATELGGIPCSIWWTLSRHSRDVVGKPHIVTMLDAHSATAGYSFTYDSIFDSMGRLDTALLTGRRNVRGTDRLPNFRRWPYTRAISLNNLTSFRCHRIEGHLGNSLGYSMRSLKTIIQHLLIE
ncbi:hypothetical protein T265_01601 [Opisthorchis viverrini]|nr:hypothetical protein T265_01601 [Opisthorchis viverrini]KER32378.1 hypothetical protein T265_01601 [Opisthorchis viverrini]